MTTNIIWQTLRDSVVETSDDATVTLKLPKSGALHALQVRARCTNGATSGLGVSIYDVLDLIEVIGDGSQVIYSLIPEVIEKRYEARNGRALPMIQNHRAGAVQEMTFNILFGRELFDPEFWLPLGGFNDLELRLRYSPTISATVGFATGTFTLDILGLRSLELPSQYLGTLVTKNVQNETSVASGDIIVDHHLQNVYRDIFIYAYEVAVADGTDITDVEIRLNDGARSVVRANWNELLDVNALQFQTNIEHDILALASDNDTLDTRISVPDGLRLAGEYTDNATADTFDLVTVDNISGDRLTFGVNQGDITAASEDLVSQTTDVVVRVSVSKKRPSYGVLVPFDLMPDPNTWLDTAQLGRLETILTQGGAGADVRVSTSEIQRFNQ